jgi:flagellar basal-body rod protein FlgF
MDRLAWTSLIGVSETAHPRTQLNNEIANVSTIGFKRSYTNVMKSLKVEGPGYDSRFKVSNVKSDRVTLTPGPIMFTGSKMDIAMNNNTVLGVTAANGDLAFTRRGDLRVNSQGVIETGGGHAVRGQDGPLTVPVGAMIEISADGTVWASTPGQGPQVPPVQVGRLLLRDASNAKLERREDSLYSPSPNADPQSAVANDPGQNMANVNQNQTTRGGDITNGSQAPSVTPGSLEGSNVSAVDALVRLMDYNRSFESNIRMIKEAKATDESGTSMMRAPS